MLRECKKAVNWVNVLLWGGGARWKICEQNVTLRKKGKWISMERNASRCDQTIYQREFSTNLYVRRPAFDEHGETLHRHWRSFSILNRRSMMRQNLEPRSLWQLRNDEFLSDNPHRGGYHGMHVPGALSARHSLIIFLLCLYYTVRITFRSR